jgi:hypothetical protein
MGSIRSVDSRPLHPARCIPLFVFVHGSVYRLFSVFQQRHPELQVIVLCMSSLQSCAVCGLLVNEMMKSMAEPVWFGLANARMVIMVYI